MKWKQVELNNTALKGHIQFPSINSIKHNSRIFQIGRWAIFKIGHGSVTLNITMLETGTNCFKYQFNCKCFSRRQHEQRKPILSQHIKKRGAFSVITDSSFQSSASIIALLMVLENKNWYTRWHYWTVNSINKKLFYKIQYARIFKWNEIRYVLYL